jgi:hypothetical protein
MRAGISIRTPLNSWAECGEAYAGWGDGYNGKCPSCADADEEDEDDE